MKNTHNFASINIVNTCDRVYTCAVFLWPCRVIISRKMQKVRASFTYLVFFFSCRRTRWMYMREWEREQKRGKKQQQQQPKRRNHRHTFNWNCFIRFFSHLFFSFFYFSRFKSAFVIGQPHFDMYIKVYIVHTTFHYECFSLCDDSMRYTHTQQ